MWTSQYLQALLRCQNAESQGIDVHGMKLTMYVMAALRAACGRRPATVAEARQLLKLRRPDGSWPCIC